MMTFRAVAGGVSVEVWVRPRASKDRLGGIQAGALKIHVAAPPVDGEANEALLRFLAKNLGVPKSSVTILRGDAGRRKSVFVAGLSTDDARRLLIPDP